MGIIQSWPALRKRRCIRQVTVRVYVDEEIISTWEKLCEGDACQGRPMVRCPSVQFNYLCIFLVLIEPMFLHLDFSILSWLLYI
jgi:hypothetical protein